MQEFLTYNLKVAVCIAAFYLFYKLLLSRETFHRLNRAVIVGVTVLSFLLPVCRVTVYRHVHVAPAAGLPLEVSGVVDALPEAFDWTAVAAAVFAAGMAAVLLRTVLSVLEVARIVREGRRERLDDSVTLVRLSREVTPFSWIRWIVVSERDLAANGDLIVAHERAHIRLRHSYDLIATDLLATLQWFNPAMWLLRAELRAVHEYEADAAVLAGGADARGYQMLLIEKAVGGRWCSVANSLNHSKLKNRITMMLRKKSSRWATARVLFVLPLVCVAAAAFARTVVVPVEDKVTENYSIGEIAADKSDAKVNLRVHVTDPSGKPLAGVLMQEQGSGRGVVTDADGRAVMQIGESSSLDLSMAGYNSVNIACCNGSYSMTGAGRMNASGSDGEMNVEIAMQPEPANNTTDKSRIKVAGKSETSEDDITVVGYVAPKVKTGDVMVCTGNLVYTNAKSALWIVDGREVSENEAKALDSDNIRDLTVYKGGAAVERYGDKGRDGVIVIRTKSAAGDNTESMHSIVTSGDKPVEYYVDGKKVSKEELAALPSGRIANMNIDKFDDRVRIDITTKKNE